MSRNARRLLVALFAGAVLAAFAVPASADTRYSAADRAYNHVLYPGCGDGASWSCWQADYVYPTCFWNSNGGKPGFWDCNGYTGEVHYLEFHKCLWYVHSRDNAIFFWHDLCRDRYGTSALG